MTFFILACLADFVAVSAPDRSTPAANENVPMIWDGFLQSEGFKVPTKSNKYSRQELEGNKLPSLNDKVFDDFIKAPLAAFDSDRLNAGCIGVVHMAVSPKKEFAEKFKTAVKALQKDDKLNAATYAAARLEAMRPELLSGVQGPWLEVQDAKTLKGAEPVLGKNNRYILFALQGPWKGGQKPFADSNGMIPKDCIDQCVFDVNELLCGHFNYAVFLPSLDNGRGLWLDANHTVGIPNSEQMFQLQQSAADGSMPAPVAAIGQELVGTIYFTRIVRGNQ